MNAKAIHINLLRQDEILSSSPIRLRVMAPVAAMIVAGCMGLWWAFIYFCGVMPNKLAISSVEQDIADKNADNLKITKEMEDVSELEAELEQLAYYNNGRRVWGGMFANLAEIIPPKVQLTRIEIPAPPEQILARPKGQSGPPLWGPEANTENVNLVLIGRTTRETPVITMMESLETDTFTNSLVICRDPNSPDQSPRVKSFRQDNTAANTDDAKQKMLAFEIEYTAKERKFSL